jgi:hypothetical protein
VAVAALLAQPNIAKAAEVAGVHAQTLKNWLKRPDFKAAYRQARREVLHEAIHDLQAGSRQAVATLVECLAAQSAGDRIKAADRLLSHAIRAHEAHELFELERRLAALERTVRDEPACVRREAGEAAPP